MNDPLLVNSIGHSVGVLLFAGFLTVVLRDRRHNRLAVIAALLALLWNAGSLWVLAASAGLIGGADLAAACSFSVLSLLPAVLLHLALGERARAVRIAGYVLSIVAVLLHVAELVGSGPRFHEIALWLITVGFAVLILMVRRLAPLASMCLFLLAISFLHFGTGHGSHDWSGEVALHHAGIPLALYLLLQDYRFLLLDAFLRFLFNGLAAAGLVVAAIVLNARFHLVARATRDPFLEGVLLVGVCLVLIVGAVVRANLQLWLTRVVFRRPDREPAVAAIRNAGANAASESDLFDAAAFIVAEFVHTDRAEIQYGDEPTRDWAEVNIPLRFAKGDSATMMLARRRGGRLYLSEDFDELGRMAAVVVEQVERLRASEMERLVSQAELRALQSQINPHFLFNALNTIYGTIPRTAQDARRMTLDLAEMLRHRLQSEHTYIPLAEEMKIVCAYLEIEALRLGDRLRTEIAMDREAEPVLIPVLSIQPLVENAVKHAIAPRSAGGTVRVKARLTQSSLLVEVRDDGEGFRPGTSGTGIGLENVRKRLQLCYGDAASMSIESTARGSTVSFVVPRRTFLATQEIPA